MLLDLCFNIVGFISAQKTCKALTKTYDYFAMIIDTLFLTNYCNSCAINLNNI